jgi:predicted unusual protein kinase regulating ubiquinone biosynthesis (AarF/ABC1/UbiB family)
MGVGRGRLRRALELTRAARRGHVVKVLREIGGGATREPTPERAREFREALEELGTTGAALADLQRVALDYRIRLPTSFALVGKTLAQADTIARTLDPELDPVGLVEDGALSVIVGDIGSALEGNRVAANVFTQLEGLLRLPPRPSEIATKLESGTLKVGITLWRWTTATASCAPQRTASASRSSSSACSWRRR